MFKPITGFLTSSRYFIL